MALVTLGEHAACESKGANLFYCRTCAVVHVEDWLVDHPCRPKSASRVAAPVSTSTPAPPDKLRPLRPFGRLVTDATIRVFRP